MNPIIFQTDIFILHTFWIFFVLALVLGTYVFIKLSLKHRLKLQFISENSWKFIFWGLIGGRLLAIIANFNIYFYEFSSNTIFNLLAIWDRGFSIWGVVIAVIIYLYYLCKNSDQDFWHWLDVLIPAFIIGLAISHLGSFFEGSNYGHETSLPWGVNFENYAVKYAVPIHPTQIYAFLYSVGISSALIHFGNTQRMKEESKRGLIGLAGITAYALFRFLEEFLRGDDVWMVLGIRVSQIVAFAILTISSIILYKRYKK